MSYRLYSICRSAKLTLFWIRRSNSQLNAFNEIHWLMCVCVCSHYLPRPWRRPHLTNTFCQATGQLLSATHASVAALRRDVATINQIESAERPNDSYAFRWDTDESTVHTRSSSHLSTSSWLCCVVTVSLLYYSLYQHLCGHCSLVNTLNSNIAWVRLLTLPLALRGWSLCDSTWVPSNIGLTDT